MRPLAFHRSQPSATRVGEPASTLNNLGLALVEVRRFDEAIVAYQQALDRFREAGDRHGEGRTLNNLGLALVEVRRFEEAIVAYQQALAPPTATDRPLCSGFRAAQL